MTNDVIFYRPNERSQYGLQCFLCFPTWRLWLFTACVRRCRRLRTKVAAVCDRHGAPKVKWAALADPRTPTLLPPHHIRRRAPLSLAATALVAASDSLSIRSGVTSTTSVAIRNRLVNRRTTLAQRCSWQTSSLHPAAVLVLPALEPRLRYLTHQVVAECFPQLKTFSVDRDEHRRTVVCLRSLSAQASR